MFKKHLLVLPLLVLLSVTGQAQQTPKEIREESDFIVTWNNDTILGHMDSQWNVTYTGWGGYSYGFTTKDGVKQKYNAKEIKSIYYNRSLREAQPRKPEKPDSRKDFMQVYMRNADKYTLYCYATPAGNGTNVEYYLFKDGTFIEEIKKKNHKAELLKYFGNCKELELAFKERDNWFGKMDELANRYWNNKCY